MANAGAVQQLDGAFAGVRPSAVPDGRSGGENRGTKRRRRSDSTFYFKQSLRDAARAVATRDFVRSACSRRDRVPHNLPNHSSSRVILGRTSWHYV